MEVQTPRAGLPRTLSPSGSEARDAVVPNALNATATQASTVSATTPTTTTANAGLRFGRRMRSLSTSDLYFEDEDESLNAPNAFDKDSKDSNDLLLADSTSSLLPPSDSLLQMFNNANPTSNSNSTSISVLSSFNSVNTTAIPTRENTRTERSVSRVRSQRERDLRIITPATASASVTVNPSPALAHAVLPAQTPQASLHHHHQQQQPSPHPRNYSFYDYLKGQMLSSEYSNDNPDYMNVKKERIENFLSVPYELEKLMVLGYLICLDSFLYVFTILPARILLALKTIVDSVFWRSIRLSSSQKCDLMKGLLVAICCYMLENVDGSRLYHSVRGQSTIKLYVIFNLLEICDKLCSAFGHDVLDSLFSKTTTNPTPALSLRRINRVTHFSLALLYVFVHSMVLFYQVMALNVAINSYNNALLSLLLSNQFIEIKGSVFKKFERENLFQLSCSDIVERFQLSIFLLIISVRNLVELTGATATTAASFNPFTLSTIAEILRTIATYATSFLTITIHILSTETPFEFLHRVFTKLIPEYLETILDSLPTVSSASAFFDSIVYGVVPPHVMSIVQYLAFPVLAVLGTELIVDWLKHAFITKFNQLKVGVVYKKYRETLCRDLVVGMDGEMGFIDKSPHVARRIGFVSVPLACLVVRVTLQTLRMLCTNGECGIAPWTLDWRPPRGSVSRAIGDAVGCLVGNGELDCLKGVWGRVVGSVWLTVRIEVIAGVALKVLIMYFILLALKLVVGYELIRLAQKKIYEIAVSSTSVGGGVGAASTANASDPSHHNTVGGISGSTTIPTTPTGKLRKGSVVSLVDLERQALQLQQNQPQQNQPQQQQPQQLPFQHVRDNSVNSSGGGGGIQPQRRASHMTRGASIPVGGGVTELGNSGGGVAALIGDDKYGAFIPSHLLPVAATGGGGEKESNLVVAGGVLVAKDDKLDRVDRFAMDPTTAQVNSLRAQYCALGPNFNPNSNFGANSQTLASGATLSPTASSLIQTTGSGSNGGPVLAIPTGVPTSLTSLPKQGSGVVGNLDVVGGLMGLVAIVVAFF
ncbi:UNVERIFIED_CONTAM: hypothetical protein HDU68_004113 [Siphonaria sp. JEL0065]|nr:hypothetical protein HDU68_004113 [Siphonaria sp. JEL0065]